MPVQQPELLPAGAESAQGKIVGNAKYCEGLRAGHQPWHRMTFLTSLPCPTFLLVPSKDVPGDV